MSNVLELLLEGERSTRPNGAVVLGLPESGD